MVTLVVGSVKSYKVLVCGGRDYFNSGHLNNVLNLFVETVGPISLLINGGARGADTLAYQWATDKGINTATYKADWTKHKKAAGPIRNQFMLEDSDPDLVIAFKGGNGTKHMIDISRKAGKTVIEVAEPLIQPELPPIVNYKGL